MKHSKYVMMAPWEIPVSIKVQSPVGWDRNWKPTMFCYKPAFISAHQTTPNSTADGFVVCIRKMELDPMRN